MENKKIKDDLDKVPSYSSITYWMTLAAAVDKDNGVIVTSCVLSFLVLSKYKNKGVPWLDYGLHPPLLHRLTMPVSIKF